MDEQKLHEILGQNLEVPDLVNKKLEQTYAQLEGKRRPKRRGLRPLRTVLVVVALIAALCATATAAYNIFRQEVPVDTPQTVQGVFGKGRPSWDETYIYDEFGKQIHYPRREVEPVNPDDAQALLGDYLPESGYRWQIEDYTLTVEGYVLDERTGTAKFYYTVEHPGGFGEGAVDWEHGLFDWEKNKVSVSFHPKSEDGNAWFGGRIYVDVARSTEEKLCVVDSVVSAGTWKAEDGMSVSFRVLGDPHEEVLPDGSTNWYRDDDVLSVALELPGLKSLPTVPVSDPATGDTVLELSAIGLMLKTEDMDLVDYIALDYADGTRYVVRDDAMGLDNTDYGLGSGDRPDMTLREVFNRLVDPSQVVAVTVDGQRYEVN